MAESREVLEAHLNDFEAPARRKAFKALVAMLEHGGVEEHRNGRMFNLHCHSFFSYNGYGYSPSALAWRGAVEGLYAMGIVDFDVLDGVDEFLDTCTKLNMRACAGFETRVFVPEFATRVINSPGEPGISYHMGAGFTRSHVKDAKSLARFKATAQARTRDLAARVSTFLDPVVLDYEKDVLPLTPSGNPTERHVCTALDARARIVFPDPAARARFWAEKLNDSEARIAGLLEDAPTFQGLIRSKTMKAGGAGYVRPDGKDFPTLEEVNAFVLAQGAIPTFAFLDGGSEGEQAMPELLDVMTASGVAAVNIIPDRNWNISNQQEKKRKVQALYAFVQEARNRCLPIIIGTEMNAYGQRFVDDFNAPELTPLVPAFLEGAHILYAHTRLHAHAEMGYLSPWAKSHFRTARHKNSFFAEVGKRLQPGDTASLEAITADHGPDQILEVLNSHA